MVPEENEGEERFASEPESVVTCSLAACVPVWGREVDIVAVPVPDTLGDEAAKAARLKTGGEHNGARIGICRCRAAGCGGGSLGGTEDKGTGYEHSERPNHAEGSKFSH
ncbi:hypothetical protein NicSoilC12_33740 [Arthrobacter sp. NicSoilC12]|nr:hypothetical protein NicSoilC12_33740 [Arthrobacter sp. NicSoilC12]